MIMKKLNRLTLNKIDQSNLLNKNELKQIKGGYISCTIYDSYGSLFSGSCAMSSASQCRETCNNAYAGTGITCSC